MMMMMMFLIITVSQDVEYGCGAWLVKKLILAEHDTGFPIFHGHVYV
jgi:hypothetical protein